MSDILASCLRLSTPLIFAALGGLLCERAGVATICLEGVMLVSAWTAATVTFYVGDPWVGLVAGVFAGILAMSLHALLSITARANAVISGVAVNILAAGITPLLTKAFFGSSTSTASLPVTERLGAVAIPGLSSLPGLGPLFFDQPVLIYAALILPFVVHWLLNRTGFGLWILAAGDGPEALRTSGVRPESVRWAAFMLGGAITALGGVYLSISHASQFTRDMTSGRGFIALTALIFGKWKPLPAFAACLFFGFFDALQIRLQSTTVFGNPVPVQFVQALPYLVALVVLAGFIGRARPPIAIENS